MYRSARYPFLGAGSCRKDHVPMGSLIQPRKVLLPNFVVFAQEPGDDPIIGLVLGIPKIHPKSPFAWLPYTLMVVDVALLRKRTIRDFAAFIHVHCVNTLSDHFWRGSINVRGRPPSVAEIEALGLRAQRRLALFL